MSQRTAVSLAYANFMAALKQNSILALSHIPTLNEMQDDQVLYNQLVDQLMGVALEITEGNYKIFEQAINELSVIEDEYKPTYLMVAKIFASTQASNEEKKCLVEEALQFEFKFPLTSFLIDVFNMLVGYSIYINDTDLLHRVIDKMNQLY